MKWRIYREAVEEVNLKKLLKQNGVTKLPSGTEFKPDRVSWSKDGGYAGQKTLDKICSQLEDAGWKRGEWRTGGIPDGSAVTNSNAYTSPDGQLVMTYSEHFGVTAHDNFYGFTFKLAERPVNESDEDFDDYDEEIDYCVQYAKDAIDRILNQPGIDDFILSRRGKITVPLKALLPYEGGTPDEELVEAICQRCSDDKIKVTGYGSGWTLIFPDIANQMNESSRFGFNVGDKVELKVGKEPNRFGGWGKIEAGSRGEIVAIDKPMPGAIKVKLEDGTVVTMGERQLKLAGTDNEPWKTLAANRPPEPKRNVRPERPEDYYMRPTSYGSPRYTGD